MPICYVLREGKLYTPIDEKRKKKAPEDLRRIINIKANPNVCIVVDHYEENWRQLRFVMIHGKAKIIRSGKEHAHAITDLRRKYQQYQSMNLQRRPIITISPARIKTWKADFRIG